MAAWVQPHMRPGEAGVAVRRPSATVGGGHQAADGSQKRRERQIVEPHVAITT